jgi:hypothetical protein
MYKSGNYEATKLTLRQSLFSIENEILKYQNKSGANDFFPQVLLQTVNSLKTQLNIIDKHQNESKHLKVLFFK